MIISPDVDGLISANLISHLFDAELIGIYDLGRRDCRVLLAEGYAWEDAESALWLDHDILDRRIISVGQHMIHPYSSTTTNLDNFSNRPEFFSYNRSSQNQRNPHSFNPHDLGRFGWDHSKSFPECNQAGCSRIRYANDSGCRGHGGNWTKADWNNNARGFRRKYPFATIHMLIAALQHHDIPFNQNARLLTAHSDSAWLAATQNATNAEWWLSNVLNSEPNAARITGTNPLHTTDRQNMEDHLRLIRNLDDLGIIDLASESREQRESEVRDLSIYSAGYTKKTKQSLHSNWVESGNLTHLTSLMSELTGWRFIGASGNLEVVANGRTAKIDMTRSDNPWLPNEFGGWLQENSVFSLAFITSDVLSYTTNMVTL